MEFQAEAVNLQSIGMLPTRMSNLFGRARTAFGHWNNLTVSQKRAEWSTFESVRDALQRRFNAESPAIQATHRRMMDNFANEGAP